jgi:hypothetical protein
MRFGLCFENRYVSDIVAAQLLKAAFGLFFIFGCIAGRDGRWLLVL